jgi:SAM-dependent methyltransferase
MNQDETPSKVDLYDNAYSHDDQDVYARVRLETYGEDLGQTSWVTTQESDEIPGLLGITAASRVLEIGCGSGRYASRMAERTGCRLVGLEINAHGVRVANEMGRRANMESRVHFEERDASKQLPFEDGSFDAAFSNDVFCHLSDRLLVLRELARVLRPGGQLLFSDALVIGGLISNEELATRSSIGFYVFSPPGVTEQLIEAAGLRLVSTMDTTENAARIAKRWRDARQKQSQDLIAAEGRVNFDGLQRFLDCVHTLTAERRLLRNVYVACKECLP